MIAFSIPNIPSFTSTTPDPRPTLFVPNIKFLLKFAEGDLGIANKIISSTHLRSLGEIKDKSTLEQYLKVTGIKLPGPIDQYFVNGSFTPPPVVGLSEGSNNNLGGLNALEKSLMQSIFETQKPYFEIIKIVIDHIVIIEDIIAQLLGLLGRSKKPRGNPRALGYQQNGDLKRGLGTLVSLQKKPAPENLLSDPNGKFGNPNLTFSSSDSNYIPFGPPYTYVTQSVVFSTGQFIEDFPYTYIYKDIYEQWNPVIEDQSIDLEEEDETGKDEVLVLAVYDSEFRPVPNTDPRIDKFLDWIKPKYRNNIFTQLKPGESFDYLYAKPPQKQFLVGQQTRIGGPPDDSEGWGIKIYSEREGPLFTFQGNETAIKKGQRAIAYNSNKTQTLFNKYKTYYMEYTEQEINKNLGATLSTFIDENNQEVDIKQSTLDLVNEKMSDFGENGSIPAQIEGLLENNFMRQSAVPGNTTGLPQVSSRGEKFFLRRNDRDIEFPAYAFEVKKNINNIWIDPESEYDMKILKCDSTPFIDFTESVGAPEKRGQITKFIKKSLVINLSNNQKIGFFVPRPNTSQFDPTEFDKFDNLESLNIDWFLKVDELNFTLVEAGKTYQAESNEQLPLQIFQSNIPQQFLDFFSKSNCKFKFVLDNNRYKLIGYFNDIVLPFISIKSILIIQEFKYKRKNVVWNNNDVYSFVFGGKTCYIYEQDDNFYFIGIKKTANFNNQVPDDGVVRTLTYDIETDQISVTDSSPQSNLIRIRDLTGGSINTFRIITDVNIPNNHLRGEDVFSKGPYGSPSKSEVFDESATQQVGEIKRYQKSVDDIETFYIVEAILKSKNKNPLLSPASRQETASNPQGGGAGSYTWKDFFGLIPKFIRLIIRLATKLFPNIQKFLNLIRNPVKFITDIIISKLGDDFGREIPKFGFFGKDFLQQLTEAKTYVDELREAKGIPDRIRAIKRRLESFLNTSLIKNYVFIGDDGVGRFVLDGSSLLTLFGSAPILQGLPSISFGLQTNFSSLISSQPQPPIKLIFSINRNLRGKSLGKGDLLGNTLESVNEKLENSSLLKNGLSPSGPLYVKNEIITSAGGTQSIEELSIRYSTGVFREDVIYEYIYLTEEIENLISEAESLIDLGDSESISQATRILEEALAVSPNRKNKLVQDKLDSLKKLQGLFFTQPLLDFMLNFVALPLKVIIGIIKYILNFFKSLANPFELPGKIIEFISFKWLIDFFNPISKNSMFAMAGILFDIQTFFQVWLPSLKAGTKSKYDFNEILKLPWVTFPTYTKDEFYAKTFGAELTAPRVKFPIPVPAMIVSSLLCLIEALINTFIDFIWSILGMVDPETGKWIVIKPPYLKICKNSNNRISPNDIMKLLSISVPDLSNPETGATGSEKNPSLVDSDDSTFNFTYNVLTSDGRSVQDLNREELDKFMEENENLIYTFNFDTSE